MPHSTILAIQAIVMPAIWMGNAQLVFKKTRWTRKFTPPTYLLHDDLADVRSESARLADPDFWHLRFGTGLVRPGRNYGWPYLLPGPRPSCRNVFIQWESVRSRIAVPTYPRIPLCFHPREPALHFFSIHRSKPTAYGRKGRNPWNG